MTLSLFTTNTANFRTAQTGRQQSERRPLHLPVVDSHDLVSLRDGGYGLLYVVEWIPVLLLTRSTIEVAHFRYYFVSESKDGVP